MGGPKALIRRHAHDPTLVERAVRLLSAGGCSGITVVVGAAGEEVAAIVSTLGRDIDVVTCHDWKEGMGASLRSGLTALAQASHEGGAHVDAVLVTLVDLPDLTPDVVARVLDVPRHEDEHALRRVLRRAAYDHHPGHPALIGREHWEGVVAMAVGDHGARHYYRAHPHELIECGDLATGRDADTPGELDTSR
jgi:nicotine blue oxidoreductase